MWVSLICVLFLGLLCVSNTVASTTEVVASRAAEVVAEQEPGSKRPGKF